MSFWRKNLPWNKQDDDFSLPSDNPEFEDCTSCRVMGSTAFVALGGYTYFSGMKHLRLQQKAIQMSKSKYKYGSRQLGIIGLSSMLFGLGVYRMIN